MNKRRKKPREFIDSYFHKNIRLIEYGENEDFLSINIDSVSCAAVIHTF